MKSGVPLDNRSVIPYNPFLLLKYQAHINIERCKQGDSIKYLFKYVSKGHDRATAAFLSESSSATSDVIRDEIKMYYDVWYLSPCEAIWRILSFDINYRSPSVQRLGFHLPNEQNILYEDGEDLEDVVMRNTGKESMFLAWMKANDKYASARELTYSEFPTKFVFKKDSLQWDLRKSGFSIGRLYYVPPGAGEAFYLRMLLTVVKGPKSYKEIRTVDGVEYATFKDACYSLGLLEDDMEYIDAIIEASQWANSCYLRRLFCTLLISNCFGRPEIVWKQSWKLMADDIQYKQRQHTGHEYFSFTEAELHNAALLELESILNLNGRTLSDYESMPLPEMPSSVMGINRFLQSKMNFNVSELREELSALLSNLTVDQEQIYSTVISDVNSTSGGFYFVYGYGGTGKTYLWRTLSTSLRADGKIVLTVASSGIASLLLPKGKIAHSQFAIPLSISEDFVCNIKQGSHLAELLVHTSLIIWDEAPMANKYCFEALDRTLRDIVSHTSINASSKPFGGKVVVLGGDFRQILPVIPRGCREDIMFTTINASYLWKYCKIFTLTKNMRLESSPSCEDTGAIQEFANWTVSIGDGSVPTIDETNELISIPDEFMLHPTSDPLKCIIENTYPAILDHLNDKAYFRDCAILTSTLSVVDEVNNYVLDMLPGEQKLYLSADSVSKQDGLNNAVADLHSTEFLNTISMSGLPNHQLKLKVGAPIMLMRNIDKANGLFNGT